MDWVFDHEIWISLITLTGLEIVLGIDNIIFVSILAGKVRAEQRDLARRLGLALAMLMRIGLLLSLSWVMRLTAPLFTVLGHGVSGRDLILVLGGLFLLAKSTFEIHDKLEGGHGAASAHGRASFASVIVQIGLLDIVFSLDSVITAVGMANHLWVMITAIVLSVGVMLLTSGTISAFVERHPTLKILALSFLLLIGMSLVAEGLHQHIPKGYLYFAMAFSVFVEMLNLRLRKADPVTLHQRYAEDGKH